MIRTEDGNVLSVEVNVLVVLASSYNDGIRVPRIVNPGLNGRIVGRDMEDVGEKGRCA